MRSTFGAGRWCAAAATPTRVIERGRDRERDVRDQGQQRLETRIALLVDRVPEARDMTTPAQCLIDRCGRTCGRRPLEQQSVGGLARSDVQRAVAAEPREHRVVDAGPRRGGDAHRDGRDREFVVREQHERRVEGTLERGARFGRADARREDLRDSTPRGGRHGTESGGWNRPQHRSGQGLCDRSRKRGDDRGDQPRRRLSDRLRPTVGPQRVRRAGEHDRESDAVAIGRDRGERQGDRFPGPDVDAPQQLGTLLETGCPREFGDQASSVAGAGRGDLGDRGRHGLQARLGHPSTPRAGGDALDLVEVELTGASVRTAMGGDEAAADVRVQRLAFDTEPPSRRCAVHETGHRVKLYIDLINLYNSCSTAHADSMRCAMTDTPQTATSQSETSTSGIGRAANATAGTPLAPPGLEGVAVAETSIGDVRGAEGFYHYRGYPAVELARRAIVRGRLVPAHRRRTARCRAVRHVPSGRDRGLTPPATGARRTPPPPRS